MHCPKCYQPQLSDEVQFCSSCGLPLNRTKEAIAAAGKAKVSQAEPGGDQLSPRQKGVRQGLMLMILSVILIPAYILLAALFPANDRLVESSVSDTPFEKISQTILLTFFMLGLARMLYARFFQSGAMSGQSDGETENAQLKDSTANYALPSQSIPVSAFGSWRTTEDEMAHSQSVTEHATKPLDEE